MKQTFTLSSIILLALLFHAQRSFAQCSGTACQLPQYSDNAPDACILPAPSALDCYYGSTQPSTPSSFPPFWCTTIENNQWFAFTADAATASFNISVFGCAAGSGIQAAVLSTADCVNFTFVSACLGNIGSNSTQNLLATNLVPGEVYYLMIDGNAGAQCDFAINASLPTVNGPTSGICIPSSPNATYSTSAVSTWTINPPSAGNINGSSTAASINVTWVEPGPAEVCATSLQCPGAPEFCLPVFVGEDIMTQEDVNLCQGKTVMCGGKSYSQAGSFMVNLPTYLNCDSIINCIVHLIPTVYTTVNVNICQNGTATCAGEEFFAAGNYNVPFTNYQGCDSIVRCRVKLVPTYNSPVKLVNLCGPAEYEVCSNIYTSSGLYQEVCTGWLGCDSIINTNLAILEPVAAIAPPGILDCDLNVNITLNGTGSNVNTAIGGVTLYNWTGPPGGIIGFNNQPTVLVGQPGQYCLILTHSRAGVFCRDTACVTVTATSSVPQLPQISGNPNPCGDSTYIYTATAGGLPLPSSFHWTIPGNLSYTQLSLNTIQITWDTVVMGQMCVTANNACGASQPACTPITVIPPIKQPLMAGPTNVCAGGGNYLFTLNLEQIGTNYNWTVPAGAVLTGSGDSVMINFLNAVSGQVCVTPSNICGTGMPVCQSVQVNPIPTADLSSDAEICDGESVNLTFALTGNGLFDVTWSVGNVTSTLNDIANGHIETVSPTMTTKYKILSIADNSNPACTAVIADSVTVTVRPNFSAPATAQICAGASILLGGAMQTTAGIYTDSLQSFYGCDSVIITTLTVLPIDTTILNSTSCDPNLVGTTTDILSQTNGCDSVVIHTVTLLPSDSTLLSKKSCDLNNVGVFTQNLFNVFGCDSTVVTTVIFSLSDTTLLTAASCDPAMTGVFVNNLLTVEGCDSVIITTVSLLPSNTTNLTGSSCNPAEVGVFPVVLSNQFGCDSTVITTISFAPLDTTFLTGANCDPALTGVFTNIVTTSGGCDSVLVTTVSLLPSNTTNLTGSSCNPAEVGVFPVVLSNQFGCDSTVITTINFAPLDTTFLTGANCDPAMTGVFTNIVTTSGGCDSVLVTTVSLLPSNTTNLTGSSCNPAELGVFPVVLSNQFGCDSTVITTINFAPLDTTYLTGANCDPAMTGVFTNIVTTSGGCDSVLVTTVSLLPSNTTNLTGSSCNPAELGVFPVVLSNQFGCDSTVITTINFAPLDTTYLTGANCDPAMTGVFTNIVTTSGGCDSVLVTTVSLLPSNTTNLTGTSCNPAQVGVFPVVLSNQFGCDSTVITTINFVPLDTTYLTGANCDPAMTGVFTNIVTTSGGCDSVLVTTVSLLPESATSLSGQSCNPANVGVFTNILPNQFGCDSTITLTVTFVPVDTVFLTATTCDPASAGIFALHSVTPGGCDSVTVTAVALLPSSQTAVQTFTCDPAMAGVFVYPLINNFGCDSIVTETRSLLPSSMTNIALTTCDPTEVGAVTNVVPNQWGCDSTIVTTTSLLPANNCSVVATLQGSNIPCLNNTGGLTLNMTVGEAPFNFTVLLGGTPVANGVVNTLNTPQLIPGLAPGNYTVSITSPNGYSTTAQATIIQLVPPSLSSTANSDYAGFDVSCNGASDGTALATATGGLPPYSFSWSSGGNTAQINNLAAGMYTVTVNDANNCTNVSTVVLTEPTGMLVSFTVNDLDCFTQSTGTLIIDASGGAPPYSYALNNGPKQASNTFNGLGAGAYTLVASDANDCTQTEALVVNAAFQPNVDLGDNIKIELGGQAVLQAVVNVPLDEILSVVWTPPFDTSECPSCLTQVVSPFVSTVYTIQVQTLNGCTDEDNVTVLVDRRRQVYIPNVFSPNLDGSNDIFTVYAKPGTVRTIRSLQLYDRWGDALFVLENFQPNTATQGWDGTFRGKPLNPGVFVWVVEIEFMDGQVELFKGDVTIVR